MYISYIEYYWQFWTYPPQLLTFDLLYICVTLQKASCMPLLLISSLQTMNFLHSCGGETYPGVRNPCGRIECWEETEADIFSHHQ